MDRRRFVQLTGGIAFAGLAGCASSDESSSGTDIKDTDGDGVIDSEDYAPRDPDVQSRSDLQTAEAMTQAGATPTDTPTATPTPTPTPTPSRLAQGAEVKGQIEANYAPLIGRTTGYFQSYSAAEARATVYPSALSFDVDGRRLNFGVGVTTFSDGTVEALEEVGTKLVDDAPTELGLTYSFDPALLKRAPFQLRAYVWPPDSSLERAADNQELEVFATTDRLRVIGDQLRKDQHPESKDYLSTADYTRNPGEGRYVIDVSGDVSLSLYVDKAAYVRFQESEVQRGITVVREAIRSGIASTLAGIFEESATSAGFSSARGKVNYSVDAIQALPYVSDTVDDGFNDYNKYPIETFVEGGGDCEDTAILLAATLTADPFAYGTSLIYLPFDQPTHVATGVLGEDDVDGTYYEVDGDRYYYTETTGEGWEIGELPDQYRNESADVQVV